MTWPVFIRRVCPALDIDDECSTRRMRPRCWLALCAACLGMSSSARWLTKTWAQGVPTTISRGRRQRAGEVPGLGPITARRAYLAVRARSASAVTVAVRSTNTELQ
jgi:hypothetical protein